MTDAVPDPQTTQPGLEPGPAKTLRVAAVGDLHVGETTEHRYRDLFERVSDDADVLCLCCLLYTSPSPRDLSTSRMPSSA